MKISRLSKLFILVVCLGLVGGGILVYRIFFVRLIRVPTGAMMNTILPGDQLVVYRSSSDIVRGSVVMFQYPDDSNRYVARVIGLPGETIEIRQRAIYINGEELPEEKVLVGPEFTTLMERLQEISVESFGPYRVYYTQRADAESIEVPAAEAANFGVVAPFRIGDAQFFLLGDNRDNSEDSRYRGPVPRELIWGTVSMVYWSAFRDSNQEEHVRSDRVFHKIR